MTQKINTALDAVEADVTILYADTEVAQAWASNNQGDLPVATGTYYSSRAYALETKDWAVSTDGTIHLADGNTESHISAKSAAEDAAADLVLTNADVVLTHADVVLTGLDLIATGEDLVLTNADVVLTHADVVLTHADVVLTNADVITTGINVTLSYDWANEAEDVPVSGGEYSSYHWSLKAAASAGSIVQTSNKNYFMNPNFAVNTRGYVGGTALAYREYGYDQWRAESTGCDVDTDGEDVTFGANRSFEQMDGEFQDFEIGDTVVVSVDVTVGTTLTVIFWPIGESLAFNLNPGVIQTDSLVLTGYVDHITVQATDSVTFNSLKLEKDNYTPYEVPTPQEEQIKCLPFLVDQGYAGEDSAVVVKSGNDYGVSSVVPVGTITPWNGGYFSDAYNNSFTNVLGNTEAAANAYLNPRGWYVCDGAELNDPDSPIFNGAGRHLPELGDNRFIMGYSAVGSTGGDNNMVHVHNMPHSHEYSHTHVIENHRHSVTHDHPSTNTGSTTITTTTMASHRHEFRRNHESAGSTAYAYAPTGNTYTRSHADPIGYTGSSGSHYHSHNLGSITVDTHDTKLGTNTPLDTTTDGPSAASTDQASNSENRPRYLATLYIIKVK